MVMTFVSKDGLPDSGECQPDCTRVDVLAASSAVLARRGVLGVAPQRGDRRARGGKPGAIGTQQGTSTFVIGGRTVVMADPDMVRLYELIARLARTRLPILILGESGIGKENVAHAVHMWSARAAAPLVALNCAAMQEALIEGELFGYERGAFSGAVTGKPGLFERADGGTLFLDEVNELSGATQAKLLRALEDQRVTRLGGAHARPIDIRVVAASNCDLTHQIAANRFRQDLYFRLNGATVVLPPLRARRCEIPILAQHFLVEAWPRADGAPVTISNAAMRRLLAHPWPGNIRELKHAMEYAAALVDGDRVEPWHLPVAMAQAPATVTQARRGAARPMVAPGGAIEHAATSFRPIAEELRALERRRMAEALHATGGVQCRAAELIGMPLRTFTWKLTQYGLRDHVSKQA